MYFQKPILKKHKWKNKIIPFSDKLKEYYYKSKLFYIKS